MNTLVNAIEHGLVPAGNIHRITNWVVPTISDLDVIPNLVVSDLHKVAYVSQGTSFWLLTSVSPRAWVRVNNAYPVGIAFSSDDKELTLQLSNGDSFTASVDLASDQDVQDAIDAHDADSNAHASIQAAISGLQNYLANLTKADVGLGNVDNTSDVNKPVSTAVAQALALKADMASLADVATSGDYNDLENKPAIPSVPVQSVAGKTGDVELEIEDIDGLEDALAAVSGGVPVVIAANTSLTNLHHGQKLRVVDEATITVPSGLRADFEVHILRDTSDPFLVEAGIGVTLKGVGDTGDYTCDNGAWIALVKIQGETYSAIGGEVVP